MKIDLESPHNRNLGRILELHASDTPDTVYLKAESGNYTFAQANAIVNRYANGLKQLGVEPGDRVALFMASNPEMVLLALATSKIGAIWTPVNIEYKGEWLSNSVNDCDPAVLVTDNEYLPRVEEVLPQLNCRNILLQGEGEIQQENATLTHLSEFASLDDQNPDLSSIKAGDTSAILWTSGTTGKSKGVMMSHNMWVNAAEGIAKYFGLKEGGTSYNCMPLYNCAAWSTNILFALVTGTSCAMDPVFSVTNFWDRIRQYDASRAFTLGAMHIFLWKQPATAKDRDNPLELAQMIPMPDDILEPFKERFGVKQISQAYGQSETLMIIQRGSDRNWKANALGEPVPDVEIRLLDDEGNEVPIGEAGEICVRPHREHVIFNGYFNNPEATAKAFFGEWYRTGDMARQDEDGDFFFVDRKSDYLRYKGRNVSSAQIEGVALKHPAVAQAAVIGIQSKELESEAEIKLDVVLKPGESVAHEELARFINDNAPYFMVPRYIEFRDSLPQTATNKTQKYKLRELGIGPNTWDRDSAGFKVER